MAYTNQQAQRFNNEHIGTEHILLAIIQEGEGIASQVFKNLEIDTLNIKKDISDIIRTGTGMAVMEKLPQTPRSKRVIELAIESSKELGDNYIGTGHILLGIIQERDGFAAQVLLNYGLDFEIAKKEIINLRYSEKDIPKTRAKYVTRIADGDHPESIETVLESLDKDGYDLISILPKTFSFKRVGQTETKTDFIIVGKSH